MLEFCRCPDDGPFEAAGPKLPPSGVGRSLHQMHCYGSKEPIQTKMKKTILTLLLTSTAFAQSTTVAGQRLGETFEEWLTTANMSVAEACQGHDRLSKYHCKKFTAIEGSGSGEFETAKPVARPNFRHTMLAPEIRTRETGWMFTWTFKNGKLWKASTMGTAPNNSDIAQEQVLHLTEKYGPPQTMWSMPDGALIFLNVADRFIGYQGEALVVRFLSAECAKEDSAQFDSRNPY